MSWYAVYTKPNHEDIVALRLGGAGLRILSPKIRTKKYKKYRMVEDIEPLFPRYIFADFDVEKYYHMISYTRGVRYIVSKYSPVCVQDEIIESIIENTENGIVVPSPLNLNKGDRVRINGGYFEDFQGVFEKELRGHERVAILLEAFGYNVEIDKCFVEKVC